MGTDPVRGVELSSRRSNRVGKLFGHKYRCLASESLRRRLQLFLLPENALELLQRVRRSRRVLRLRPILRWRSIAALRIEQIPQESGDYAGRVIKIRNQTLEPHLSKLLQVRGELRMLESPGHRGRDDQFTLIVGEHRFRISADAGASCLL